MATTAYTNYINHTGMSVENVEKVDLRCKRYVMDSEKYWSQYFEKATWKEGYDTFTHRKHIRPEVTIAGANALKLVEGYGAVKSNITVVKWTETVHDYGTYVPYTAESLRYNIDDTLDLAYNTFSTKAIEVPEALRSSVMCTSNFQITGLTGDDATGANLVTLLDKIKVALTKTKAKKINGVFPLTTTPEVVATLKAYLRSIGSNLDEVTKSEVTREGSVYRYNGFDIIERSDEALYADSGATSKLVVVCRTRDNELPGSEILSEIEIFDNGLGSELVQSNTSTDASPVYEADHNKRAGSLGMNIVHFGASIQADLGHLVTTFATGTGWSTGVTKPTADPINGITDTDTAPVLA